MAPVPTVYILHGGDFLRQKQQLERFRSQMGSEETASLNIHEFDGETCSVSEILAAATVVPFLSERRLVIVRGLLHQLTQRGRNNKSIDLLLDALPNLPAFTRLVFVENEELKPSHPVLKFARDSDTAHIQHNPVAKNMTNWIQRRARSEYSTVIEPRAAQALATVVEGDIHRADNELFKLASYTHQERQITESDVSQHTPYVAPVNIFQMVDALAAGNQSIAMRQLQDLLATKERDPSMLFGMIIRQFRLLLLAKEHLTTNHSSDLARALRIHPFVAQKLREQVQRFTLAQLEAIYHHLHERDIAVKTGELGATLALQMLVAELSPENSPR